MNTHISFHYTWTNHHILPRNFAWVNVTQKTQPKVGTNICMLVVDKLGIILTLFIPASKATRTTN